MKQIKLSISHFTINKFMYLLNNNIKYPTITIPFGCLLSVACIVGTGLNSMDSPGLHEFQSLLGVLVFLAFIILWFCYTYLVEGIFWIFDRVQKSYDFSDDIDSPVPSLIRIVLVRIALLMIIWFPWLIITLPGSIHGDYIIQLLQHLGVRSLSNHHPYLVTCIYGFLYDVGYNLGGSGSSAVCFTAIVQAFLLSGSFSIMISSFQVAGVKSSICRFVLLYAGLVPIIPLYAFFCIKDTISLSVVLLFMTQIGLFSISQYREFSKSKMISLPAIVIMGILCSILRHNFVYCIVPTVAFLPYASKYRYLIGFLLSLIILISNFLFNNIILKSFNIESGSMREVLSVPIQITAAYLKAYPDDVSEYERQVIAELVNTNVEAIANSYTYKISDPVKSHFIFSDYKSVLSLLKLSFSIIIKHPFYSLTTFLRGNYGYWYPFLDFDDVKWATPLSLSPEAYIKELQELGVCFSGNAKDLTLIASCFPQLRDMARDTIRFIGHLPIISLLFQPSFYVLFTIIIGLYMKTINSKYTYFVIFCLFLFATCCASPDFSNMRYALPFVGLLPLSIIMASLPHQKCGCSDYDNILKSPR